MPSNRKQPSQGQGRVANSEPRIQVFKGFQGCNFELSPRDFTLGSNANEADQSDLQMNYVVVQNNASVSSNLSIETRNNLVTLFSAPSGQSLTDACILIRDRFYIGLTNGDIAVGDLPEDGQVGTLDQRVRLVNNTGSAHEWRSFVYVDSNLVGLTKQNEIWSGKRSSATTVGISNSKEIPNPSGATDLRFSDLTKQGDLKISQMFSKDTPHRIGVAMCYIGKYGPTLTGNRLDFYANRPVDEWNTDAYLKISKSLPKDSNNKPYEIDAIEFFFTVDEAQSMQYAGRAEIDMEEVPTGQVDEDDEPIMQIRRKDSWTFNWLGYLDIQSKAIIANKFMPENNYTKGVPASRARCIDNRMYFWGSESEPNRLFIGGNPGNLLSVSTGTGGGFVDVDPGTDVSIRYVDKYKTQGGNSIVTMLCDSPNSTNEQRYNLVENTSSLSNEQNSREWEAEQVAGAVGCKSYYGGLVAEDGLYSISRYGLALTTMTMEYNSQIRPNYVSDAIRPVFTDPKGNQLSKAVLLDVGGVVYCCFGNTDRDELDNMIFCYDIGAKAWWTYTLDTINEPILNMIHIDSANHREGIGIVTSKHVYLLPTTMDDPATLPATFNTLIETGELSTLQPQQNWFYLSQMEFRFDYFIGDLNIKIVGIDQFGRKVTTEKNIHHSDTMYDLVEYMRVDLRLENYKVIISGRARFRMSHFMSKVYTMSSKQGIVWGFDDSQSCRSNGDIHPTFKSYNDIRLAIIP